MPDKPFVINDRRKFTAEGERRPDAETNDAAPTATPASEPPTPGADAESRAAEPSGGPKLVQEGHAGHAREPIAFPSQNVEPPSESDESEHDESGPIDHMPPPPTAEEIAQVNRAFDSTVDRLDTAMRAMNPGAEHAPPMNFERLVQSLYMQALLQLGGATEPGQPMRVDLVGARATIDMLAVLAEKTRGNVSENEEKLLESALFELRLGFLDVTRALSEQAAQRQPGKPGAPGGGMPPMPGGGPSILH